MQGCLIDGSAVKPLHVELEKSNPAKRNNPRIVIAEGKHREVAVQRIGTEMSGQHTIHVEHMVSPV